MTKSILTGSEAKFLFSQPVLGRYEARYMLDEKAGYIFVEAPYWLDEAYSSAIAVTDTGILYRNLRNIHAVSNAVHTAEYPFNAGVDLGGGYGVFVRGMRDAGFDFRWTDRYAENLFARGFEAASGERYEIAVCFEVLEHVVDPLSFLRDALTQYRFDTCFFSASCFDEGAIPGRDWWYWSPETGQHISFFSVRSLEWIAGQLGMRLFRIGTEMFVFSAWDWSSLKASSTQTRWRAISRRLARTIAPSAGLAPELPRGSFLGEDFLTMREMLRNRQSASENMGTSS